MSTEDQRDRITLIKLAAQAAVDEMVELILKAPVFAELATSVELRVVRDGLELPLATITFDVGSDR